MPNKKRLLASAAMPLALVLALSGHSMAAVAQAPMMASSRSASDRQLSVDVAQAEPMPAPDAGNGDELRRKDRKKGEARGDAGGRPQPQPGAADGGGKPERKRPEAADGAGQDAGAPEPRAAKKPKTAPPGAPAAGTAASEPVAPAAAETERKRKPKPADAAPVDSEAPTPPPPPAAAAEKPAAKRAKPAEPAPEAAPQEAPKAAEKPKAAPAPAAEKATKPGAKEAQKPAAKPATPPAAAEPGAAEPAPAPAEQAAPGAQTGKPRPDGQPRDRKAPAEPSATDNAGRTPPPPPAPNEQMAPAGNTATAPNGSPDGAPREAAPARLPVDNGAPVLDSQKGSARPGDAGGRPRPGRNDASGRPQDNAAGADAQVGTPPVRPRSDADAQRLAPGGGDRPRRVEIRPADAEKGKRIDEAPRFAPPQDVTIINREDNRYIYNLGDRPVVENNDRRRLGADARDVYYEDLPGGRTREVVERRGGVRVVTIRNSYGEVLQRSRFDRDGRETVLFYAPIDDRGDGGNRDRRFFRDAGEDLPPLRLAVPLARYILDASGAGADRDVGYYEDFLEQPPVEPLERVYTLDEVKHSARIRDVMPRIDLDTITFEFGRSDVPEDQVTHLQEIADAIKAIIDRNPAETFLIEGHTDAVGTDEANLLLSDKRAESVAVALTDAFGLPPENLTTQGYGEQYLKIDTQGPERENRRVTIRRITPLVRPVASNE